MPHDRKCVLCDLGLIHGDGLCGHVTAPPKLKPMRTAFIVLALFVAWLMTYAWALVHSNSL